MTPQDKAKSLALRFPRDFIGISGGFTSKHKGVDLGWNSNYGGKTAPIYASAAGTVKTVVDGKVNSPTGGIGNEIVIDHGDGVYTVYGHLLKGSITVREGDKVKKHQQIAKMGNSGASNGYHVHFGLFLGGMSPKYVVDPLKYVYAFPEDTVTSKSDLLYDVMRYSKKPVYRLTAADLSEEQVNQLVQMLAVLGLNISVEEV